MKKNIKRFAKLSSFTLIELIFVVMIISLIMPAMFALYNFIVRSNREISARQGTIQQ
jgi:type II secretory pathway pseudopilin PulG